MGAIACQSRTVFVKNKKACKLYRFSEMKLKMIAAGMLLLSELATT
jgi:hypothetical protein